MILVLCNTNSPEEAKNIARTLVENSAAACVNIIKNEASVYMWENELVEESEYQLLIKTKRSLFQKVERLIKQEHSYDVPEIISIDIADGSADYIEWVRSNTI